MSAPPLLEANDPSSANPDLQEPATKRQQRVSFKPHACDLDVRFHLVNARSCRLLLMSWTALHLMLRYPGRVEPEGGPERQSMMMLHQVRLMLNRRRTQLSNAIRAHLSEFGIVASVGRNGVDQLLKIVADPKDDRIPEMRACVCRCWQLSLPW